MSAPLHGDRWAGVPTRAEPRRHGNQGQAAAGQTPSCTCSDKVPYRSVHTRAAGPRCQRHLPVANALLPGYYLVTGTGPGWTAGPTCPALGLAAGWPQGGAGPAQGTLPLAFVPGADKAHRPARTPGGPGRHWGPRWGQPTWQCVTGTCPRPDDSCRQGERDRVPGPCDCRPRSIRSIMTETPPGWLPGLRCLPAALPLPGARPALCPQSPFCQDPAVSAHGPQGRHWDSIASVEPASQ